LVQEVITQNHQRGGGYGKSFKGSPFDPLIDTTFGRGLFFAEDTDRMWSVAHKVLTKPFSHRGVMSMFPTICQQANKLVAALDLEIEGGKRVYVYDYMVKMALETIAVCSMGTSLRCFDSEDTLPFPVAFQEAMDSMLELLNVPASLWFCCFGLKRRMNKAVQRMNSIIDDIVQQRVQKKTQAFGKDPDLLDIMLTGESGAKLDPQNIRSQVLTFLFAGHDSTAAAMSSFIVFMLANPDVEAKVVEEIQHVVGDGEVEPDHLNQLKYLDWCMKESLRLLPPAGNYQRMAFQDDMLLGGRYKVKRDAPVIVDIFTLHMDPETWGPDAAHFVPERWEAGPPHPCSFMPFASGPRGCIGKEFSLVEQKIVAVKLFQNFIMKRAEGSVPRTGSILIEASKPLAQPILGIDAEFNPKQFFAGASIPVILQRRARRPTVAFMQPSKLGGS